MPDEPFEKADLPSGGWVALRDPKTVTERDRKPLKRARSRVGMAKNLIAVLNGEMSPADLADSEVDLLERLMESVAVVLVTEWSITGCDHDPHHETDCPEPQPLPISIESLGDLAPEDYEALIDAVAKHRDALIPGFEPTPEQHNAEGGENPTGPSNGSKTPSPAATSTDPSRTTSSAPGSSSS